ncbi:transposase [Thiorhodovibrio frisius]|uniref:Transposase n=1 Tax=Thiorhodovibrio frisius TaxID=631362 RepID=H8YW99_9GAMM|nr:transposase [Thiorhodovibrio frisius]WPL20091.1 Transposase [Thiorhodovibrio frisius]
MESRHDECTRLPKGTANCRPLLQRWWGNSGDIIPNSWKKNAKWGYSLTNALVTGEKLTEQWQDSREQVVPGLPHHVTQRGNRRQQTFFSDDDYAEYRRLLALFCRACETQVLAYCFMPNHVHLILVPATEFGLRDAFGEDHRRYTRMINFRQGWRRHLWQDRFHSFVMDERHLIAAARYVDLNPVRARLCQRPTALISTKQ